jgi:hypothetical protein
VRTASGKEFALVKMGVVLAKLGGGHGGDVVSVNALAGGVDERGDEFEMLFCHNYNWLQKRVRNNRKASQIIGSIILVSAAGVIFTSATQALVIIDWLCVEVVEPRAHVGVVLVIHLVVRVA